MISNDGRAVLLGSGQVGRKRRQVSMSVYLPAPLGPGGLSQVTALCSLTSEEKELTWIRL